MRKPCGKVGCPNLVTRGRCSIHQREWERKRGTAAQRGYDARHRAKARATINEQPWCSWCYATVDLTADHVVSGDPDSDYQTLCRSCNTKKRNAEARQRKSALNP